MIRVRSFVGAAPCPGLDVTTGSQRVALDEARDRAERYGNWDDVQVTFQGERPFRGEDLRQLVERAAR